MQYNGQEVELITEGYWPEGVTLICSDDGKTWKQRKNCVYLANGKAFSDFSITNVQCSHWALLPAKPAPRRLTNREVAKLCRAGWDVCASGTVYQWHPYQAGMDNDPAGDKVKALRAPDSDEWIEPTSDLLEVVE